MKWAGNITLKMDEKEDTYPPGSIDVTEYTINAVALVVSSKDERAKVTIRMSKEEYRNLVNELTQRL